MTEYKSFEEMPVWQKAHILAVEIFHVSEHFPRKEDYGLTSQLRRAALSIPANIAEAFGRFHYRDKLNFTCKYTGTSTTTAAVLLTKPRATFFMPEMSVTSRIRLASPWSTKWKRSCLISIRSSTPCVAI